jgi:hypothetical protein
MNSNPTTATPATDIASREAVDDYKRSGLTILPGIW